MRRALLLLVLAACGDDAAHHLPDAPPPDVMACTPTGTPVMHAGAIDADETWASGIHVVTATVTVTAGTLTIAPCTEVRLAANASIELQPTATALLASGTGANPIEFVRDDAAAPWGHLFATGPAVIELSSVTLTGGGTAGDYKTADQLGATLVVRGDATLAHLLTVNDVIVDGSSGMGIFLNSARFATTSTNLTVSHAGAYPILMGADSASELPAGAYTSNGVDQILLQSSATSAAFEQQRTLLADSTIHDRGVPYRVGLGPATIVVGDGVITSPHATLTIEAGVTMLFSPQGATGTSRLQVRGVSSGDAQGALVVNGTAAKPVTFGSASATPAAGDWQGLEFRNAIDPLTQIDHAIIQDAGGPSYAKGVCESKPGTGDLTEDGAVIISLANQLFPTAFLMNSAISNSAGVGVYRGWSATDVDFLVTNTFTSVAGCLQTDVPNASNQCPATPCPVN